MAHIQNIEGRIPGPNAHAPVKPVAAYTGAIDGVNARAWGTYESRYRLAVAGLTLARATLFSRIAERVDRMIEAGLIEEARALAAGELSVTARQALGYRQVLEAGEDASVDDIKRQIVRATKRFARRQESWFRADPRVAWFDAGAASTAGDVTAYLMRALGLTPGRAPS